MLNAIASIQDPIAILQYAELSLNHWAQESLKSAEPMWIFLSEYVSAGQITDIFVPLVGAIHHQLMVRLVCSLAIVNIITSLIKWCSPEYRPYWWIHEFPNAYNTSTLKQHRLSCETTGGFPSSHSIAFTTFMYLLLIYILARYSQRWRNLDLICYMLMIIGSIGIWLSRIYLATQFLHQCLMASFLAVTVVNLYDQHSTVFYNMGKATSVLLVLCVATLPIVSYFAMLRMGLDPHWSVRMAFKWCADPSYLRHESSPIFLLGRDFGYLTGVALSAPVSKIYEHKTILSKRLTYLFVLEVFNVYVRLETPKKLGRLVFVAYEFARSMIHSYSLLAVLSRVA